MANGNGMETKFHKMKNIEKLVIIEVILFLVAGLITVLVGKFTVDSYGTILISVIIIGKIVSGF
jgi:hypothetical protein